MVNKPKAFVAACSAGLGNRIKCMVSIIGSSKDYKPQVYWPINNECGCSFDELFEKETIFKEIGRSELYGVEVDAKYGDAYINKSWKIDNDSDIDFMYHKLPQAKIDEILECFADIYPKEDIIDAAWAFRNKYIDSFNRCEVIGVHIRKGDFKGLQDGRYYVSQESDFIERMKNLLEVNPNYKFLLCTEDEETEEKFRSIFGSNAIIYFPKRFRGRTCPNAIKEAFVDILLLSECPIIIGTFLSTFTEIAWWIGGCKAKVVIPGTSDKEAVAKVLSKLPQKGEWIHKKILRRIRIWIKEGI